MILLLKKIMLGCFCKFIVPIKKTFIKAKEELL